MGRHNEYQWKPESKQAHHVMHQTMSMVLAGVWLWTSDMEITANERETVAH